MVLSIMYKYIYKFFFFFLNPMGDDGHITVKLKPMPVKRMVNVLGYID